MPSYLQQLENNESILLMYLADELDAQDRAEVAQMLATDAGLRGELAHLEAQQEDLAAGLAKLDRLEPLVVSQAVAGRRVGRALAQWHAARTAKSTSTVKAGPRYPWWAYPAAAAAAVMLAFLVWWGNQPDTTHLVIKPIDYPVVFEPAPESLADDAVVYGFLDPEADPAPEDADSRADAAPADVLDEVEQELYAISRGDSSFLTLFADPADMEAAAPDDF